MYCLAKRLVSIWFQSWITLFYWWVCEWILYTNSSWPKAIPFYSSFFKRQNHCFNQIHTCINQRNEQQFIFHCNSFYTFEIEECKLRMAFMTVRQFYVRLYKYIQIDRVSDWCTCDSVYLLFDYIWFSLRHARWLTIYLWIMNNNHNSSQQALHFHGAATQVNGTCK